MNKFKNIDDIVGLKIQLASPEQILEWSNGEVTKPETINYRTWKPEKDGLFCEKIFGPSKDYECYCGKYKKIRFKGIICDKCEVEVTTSKVRRERMGHIDLATPVTHLWFLKNSPSPLSLILGVSQKDLEAVVYFTKYLVTEVDNSQRKKALDNLFENVKQHLLNIDKHTEKTISQSEEQSLLDIKKLKSKIKNKEQLGIAVEELKISLKQEIQKIKNKAEVEKNKVHSLSEFLENTIKKIDVLNILSDDELFYLSQFKADIFFKASMGAEAILGILKDIDLNKTVKSIKKELSKTKSKIKKKKLMHKIRILNGMLKSQTNPAWMVLTKIPVIPPDLRPMVQLSGGRFATSDLNDLYRRLINRNNRLKKLLRLGAPEIILRNEKRMLQESVDSLIDSQKTAKNKRKSYKRIPRSLSDLLRGKKGRFRRNLLGKRVDYSGRSAIVVGPELTLNQVGLPKKIALEMYRPFVIRELMRLGFAPNIKSAKNLIDHQVNEVYDVLDLITKDSFVLLNRAPTLHKLSIQAFKPKLIDGLAIQLHPCVCSGFNADFDGDQMGVHLPLSTKALKEAKRLMLPSHNILKASDGNPILVPTQEMAVGCYYITSIRQQDLELVNSKTVENLPIFADSDEAELAYQSGKIDMRQLVVIRIDGKLIKTSLGRIRFNAILPREFDFINEAVAGSKFLKNLLIKSLKIAGRKKTVKLVDSLKNIGFYAFSLSGLSLSVQDCGYLPAKARLISEAEKKVSQIEDNYKLGLITVKEKERLAQSVWMDVTEEIAIETWATLDKDSPIKVVSAAGIKRASKDQIKQLSGMRGLMVDPTGHIVPLPTKSNFREGLSPFEYVTGARGTRKGLADTALKTADAGYLTRRLVDATHACLVRQEDCGTKEFLTITADDKNRGRYFLKRLVGRFLANNLTDPKTKKVLISKGEIINDEVIEIIKKHQIVSVDVRSPIKCKCINGICKKCYGWDLSTRKIVSLGVPVGVIAAQSIGEPGTQLTLRTKHTGGVVGVDVTQGLPRVQELFEIRTPKIPSPLAEINGKIRIKEGVDAYEIRLSGKDENGAKKIVNYILPLSLNLLVSDGDLVAKGTPFCSGSLDIREILTIKGMDSAQKYLIDSIQGVYESQGISVHDKHFEILVKEMSDKIKIENPGDSLFLYGQYVTRAVYNSTNQEIKKQGGKPARGRKVLLGLIQSALTTDSWLSSASFQQTTNVLTEASLLGEVDHLIGLKENVIIGRLIPVSMN